MKQTASLRNFSSSIAGGNTNERRTMFLFSFPSVLIYSLFFLIPLLYGIYYSFTNWTGFSPDFDFIALDNYSNALSSIRFKDAMLFNLKYTLLLVIFVTFFSLIAAVLLNQKLHGINFYRSINFFPAVIATVTVGLIWNEIFLRALPTLGQTWDIPFLGSSLLGKGDTAFYAVLMVNIWQGCAIPTVLFLAGLQSIPQELLEASRIDGADIWQQFWRIKLPFLIPSFNIVLITTIRNGLTTFDYIKVLTNGGPAQATEAIGLLIYKHAFSEGKLSASIAESILLFLMISLVSFLTLKFTKKLKAGENI